MPTSPASPTPKTGSGGRAARQPPASAGTGPHPQPSAAVDAYIARAAPFAQPILEHLRHAVHTAVPGIEEAMKWSMPFFVHRGVILGNMAAFKQHCRFGLWDGSVSPARERAGEVPAQNGMGGFARLTSVDDLPPPRELKRLLLEAAQKIENGTRTKAWTGRTRRDPSDVAVPEALTAMLARHPDAAAAFAKLSPSCRREYAAWVAEAKKDDTRERRLAKALPMILGGRGMNYKHQAR